MDSDFDCVVVGGGVAGQSAAMVLARTRRRRLVLDRGRQSNRAAAQLGGLLGHDGTPPREFYELARAEGAAYAAVALGDGGGEVRARALVLATGMAYEVPDVPGFADSVHYWRREAIWHRPSDPASVSAGVLVAFRAPP